MSMSDKYHWRVIVDLGDNKETLVHEGVDINMAFLRIGQMALSLGIEQIIILRDAEEYRRYELKHEAKP
jgi:hypothetical protein